MSRIVAFALLLLSASQAFAQPPDKHLASLFGWRDQVHQRLQRLEDQKQAPAPLSPQAQPDNALLADLRLQVAALNAQIAALQQKPAPAPQQQAPTINYYIYQPGGPPIALNPQPGPTIPLNQNPGPVIPLNPQPGPVLPLNQNPGPVLPLNPNPGPPIQLKQNPGAPIQLQPSAPPTGYQTYTVRPPVVIETRTWSPAR